MLKGWLILAFLSLAVSCSAIAQSHYDFEAILDHKIIGFGELSHGNKYGYEIKASLVRQMLERHGSADILIEMPYSAEVAIKAFSNNEMDSTELLEELKFYGLQTDAFLSFFSEFSGDDRVRIYSVDMQHWKKPNEVWFQNMAQLLPDRREELGEIKVQFAQQFSRLQDTASDVNLIKTSFKTSITKLRTMLAEQDGESSALFYDVLYPLQVVEQCFEYYSSEAVGANGWDFFLRDSCMAANAIAIIERSSNPILVVGANLHVSKREQDGLGGTMGWYISKAFGDDYFAISSQALSGQVLSIVFDKGRRPLVQQVQADKKSLPYKIDKQFACGDTLFLMNDACAADLKIFCKKVMMQDFGAGGGKESDVLSATWKLVACKNFDAVFYSPAATLSTHLVD